MVLRWLIILKIKKAIKQKPSNILFVVFFRMEINLTKDLTIKNIVIGTEYEPLLIRNGTFLARIQTLNIKSNEGFTIRTKDNDEFFNQPWVPFEISWDRFTTFWLELKWTEANQTITLFIKY